MSAPRLAAMNEAIRIGDAARVRLLLRAGVPADGGLDGVTWVRFAASLVREEIFELLVAAGARLDEPELLEWAVDGGGGRIVPSLAVVRRILAANPPDPGGATRALRFACVHEAPEVVAALLEAGADPDGGSESTGVSALGVAARYGRIAVIDMLLAAGADPTRLVREAGRAEPLADYARRWGHPEAAARLAAARR